MDRSTATLILSLIVHVLAWWFFSQAPPVGAPPSSAPTEVTYVEPTERERKSKAKYIDKSPDKNEVKPEDLHDAAALISNLDRRYKKQMIVPKLGPEIKSPSKSLQPRPIEERPLGVEPDETPPRERGGELQLPHPGAAAHQPAIGASSTSMRVPWVDFGDLNVLNSDRSTYYVFYERMSEQVGNRWGNLVREMVSRTPANRLQDMSKQDRRTIVEIVLDARGDFVRAHVEGGSGFEDLDYTGIEAFRMATPFVNPPRGMLGKDGLIHIHVAFEVIMRPPMMR